METAQEDLWPGVEPSVGRNRLYSVLDILRKLSSQGKLVKRIEDRLCLQCDRYDVFEFEKQITEGRQWFRSGNLLEVRRCFQRAAQLHKKPFLQSELYDEPINLRRDKLEEYYFFSVAWMADDYLANREHTLAIERYRQLLGEREEPLERELLKLHECLLAIGDEQASRGDFKAYLDRLRSVESEPSHRVLSVIRTSFPTLHAHNPATRSSPSTRVLVAAR